MKTKMLFAILLLGVMTLNTVAQTNSTDYLGQTPPGETAVIFAPGIISLPNRFESSLTFSLDNKELYFSTNDGIYFTRKEHNIWPKPVKAPFSLNGNADENPVFSSDGNSIYFTVRDYAKMTSDIWKVQRDTKGWGTPKLLPSPVNSDSRDEGYSETADGVGYITSNRPGGIGDLDIWQINKLPSDTYQAKNLGLGVNSITKDFSSCIAHDDSYLIFTSWRSGNYSYQDLWICFNKGNNEWTKPVNMEMSGAKINVANTNQGSPTLSPDGKFLFFSRENESHDQRDIYWVSTKIIDDLKKEVFNSKDNKQR